MYSSKIEKADAVKHAFDQASSKCVRNSSAPEIIDIGSKKHM